MKEILNRIDYSNPSEVEDAVKEIFYNLSSKNRTVAAQRNYKIILTNQMNRALKNNKIPFDVIPDFPKLRGKSLRRLSYLPKERKLIRERFRKETKIKEDNFYDEVADLLSICEAGGFRPKYGYDVDENGYLIPCEKEQSVICLMKILRNRGNSYKKIAEVVTKSTHKKFAQSWVLNILKRENTIPPNEEIIRHNICNVELQPNICDF